MMLKQPDIVFRLGRLALALPLLLSLGFTAARSDEPCTALSTPVCILDLARAELDGFATAPEPPESAMWTEEMARYPDQDIESEARRIVWDIYAQVAKGYAAVEEGAKAQETLDAMGESREISSRIAEVVRANPAALDRTWLGKTLSAAADAAFPFDKGDEYFDDYAWHELLDLAMSAELQEVVLAQERRFEDYAKSKDYAALDPTRQGEAVVSVLHAYLLRGDITAAERWIADITDAGNKEYGTMLLAEEFARRGETKKALALSRNIEAGRRGRVEAAAAKYYILHGNPKDAGPLLQGLSSNDLSSLANEIGGSGDVKAATAIAPFLDLMGRARLSFALMRMQIAAGDIDSATKTVVSIDEVGERAVAYGVLALAAARKGKLDVVTRAENEIATLRRYGVDAVQLADSEIGLLYAYAVLSHGGDTAVPSATVRSHVDAIVASAFPDDPIGALGASRAHLLIQLAGAQFALGRPEEAAKSLDAVAKMGGDSPPENSAYILAEAAGIAYGVGSPELGRESVLRSIAVIKALKRPMDRAMMLSHLAERMLFSR